MMEATGTTPENDDVLDPRRIATYVAGAIHGEKRFDFAYGPQVGRRGHGVQTSFTHNDGLDDLNDNKHINRPETPPRLSDIAAWSAETINEIREDGAEYATTYNQEGIGRQLLDAAHQAKQGTHPLTAFVRKAHMEPSPTTYKATRSMNPRSNHGFADTPQNN